MATYKQSITGYEARNPVTTTKLLNVPDANLSGNASAVRGGQQGTMKNGDLVLCQGPDGGMHWFRFDAERSTAANPVLIFVGP